MRSFKLFLTAFAALFAGAAIAAPEPTVPAPIAKTVQAVESIQKAKPAADLLCQGRVEHRAALV